MYFPGPTEMPTNTGVAIVQITLIQLLANLIRKQACALLARVQRQTMDSALRPAKTLLY